MRPGVHVLLGRGTRRIGVGLGRLDGARFRLSQCRVLQPRRRGFRHGLRAERAGRHHVKHVLQPNNLDAYRGA